jgi:hypothetical protein
MSAPNTRARKPAFNDDTRLCSRMPRYRSGVFEDGRGHTDISARIDDVIIP